MIASFTNVIIVHPVSKLNCFINSEYQLNEAKNLAYSIDLTVQEALLVDVAHIKAATFIGQGKIEEIKNLIKEKSVTLVIINYKISPIQQRNLEKSWDCKVIDRTGLILEIFAARAKSSEGKLQVELARLEYSKTRLVRSWTHLERQRGGLGFIGGPGETQIEADKRLIKNQIQKLKSELQKVCRTRSLHRFGRKEYPIVALVGYTNAGKSTLFNKLTGANVLAENKLFATLDTTMRLVRLPSGRNIILSDTVGFISDLPTNLVAAFRATLEEVTEADIILHVRDFASEETNKQKQDVHEILQQLVPPNKLELALVEVLNKLDLLSQEENEIIDFYFQNNALVVPISALNNIGIDKLLYTIDQKLATHDHRLGVCISKSQGLLLNWIYEHCYVISESPINDFIQFTLEISPKKIGKFNQLFSQCGPLNNVA